MDNNIQMKINGLHSGTKMIEDLPISFCRKMEIHLHPVTKEVVVIETEIVPDGSGCIDKESEVIAVFTSKEDYQSFINLIKKI